MGLSREEVRRIAALARLELTEAETDDLVRDLSDILRHVEALQGADVPHAGDGRRSAGEPISGGSSNLRGDEPGSDRLSSGPAGFAPEFGGGFFTVPRLGSHE